jgi:hypothetical protein
MLGIGWQHAEATIVSRRLVAKSTNPDMGEYASQGVEVFEFIAEVRPADGSPPFRAAMKEPFDAITFKAPEIGQVVRVKYSHTRDDGHKVKFDRSDPGTYEHVPGVPDWRHHGNPLKDADKKAVADAHSPLADAAWNAALQAPPGTPSPVLPAQHGSGEEIFAGVEARMRELEDQHTRGLLSDSELAAEQAKIIDEI